MCDFRYTICGEPKCRDDRKTHVQNTAKCIFGLYRRSERKINMKEYGKENGGTVEMPVGMALMIAGDSGACEAFASLSEERKREYIRRAKSADTSGRMKEIISDIKTIG